MQTPRRIQLKECRRLIFAGSAPVTLCGAGISMIPPTVLPSGNQLRDWCVASLLSDSCSESLVKKILASSAYHELLPESILQDISLFCSQHVDRFISRSLSSRAYNCLHSFMSREFDEIYTTNFDLCFERAGAGRVIHLHGSVVLP